MFEVDEARPDYWDSMFGQKTALGLQRNLFDWQTITCAASHSLLLSVCFLWFRCQRSCFPLHLRRAVFFHMGGWAKGQHKKVNAYSVHMTSVYVLPSRCFSCLTCEMLNVICGLAKFEINHISYDVETNQRPPWAERKCCIRYKKNKYQCEKNFVKDFFLLLSTHDSDVWFDKLLSS